MFPRIDRVYDNALARQDLGWRPKWDFQSVVQRLRETGDIRGPLAKRIGAKGYHAEKFAGAPYPVTGSKMSKSRHGRDLIGQAATPRCCGRMARLAASGRGRIRSRWRISEVAYEVETTPAGRPDGDLFAASSATRPFGTRSCATQRAGA